MSKKQAAPPFRLGVNYWPAQSAMGFWRHWDPVSLGEDFARMRGAGLDCVRLFLTWEDFQPSATEVNPEMLSLLVRTLDLAHHAGLGVMPTFFTGHMSGANWYPSWALEESSRSSRFPIISGGRRVSTQAINWYTDKSILAAQVQLAAACASALGGHPALLAWDLGNENSNCVVPDSKQSGLNWLVALTEALRARSPGVPITAGIHMEDLEEDRNLGPAEVGQTCDYLTMHGYPGYASFTAGPMDERLLPFLAQLTRYLGGGKDVFFTEFGVPTVPLDDDSATHRRGPQLVSEQEAAAYIARGLTALKECGATGAMLWCHADYSSQLFATPPFDTAPHERTFGLFRADGSEKPVVGEVRAFVARNGNGVQSPLPIIDESAFIDVARDEYYASPRENLARLFGKYCQALSLLKGS